MVIPVLCFTICFFWAAVQKHRLEFEKVSRPRMNWGDRFIERKKTISILAGQSRQTGSMSAQMSLQGPVR